MSLCYCGSTLSFSNCCEPYLLNQKKILTAETLMRARYSAYSTHHIDFLMNTTTPSADTNLQQLREATTQWANTAHFEKLEILNTHLGGENDEEGEVEFKAYYRDNNTLYTHHERGYFVKQKGKWFYDKELPLNKTIQNSDKIGRNDPCHCGSGKKYKKCCGKV